MRALVNASSARKKIGTAVTSRRRGIRVEYRKKEWRKIAKRERRRRIRREAARKRDFEEERLRATLESTAEYSNWIAEQSSKEREREIEEQRERDERERLWLQEEVRAQKEWQIRQEKLELECQERLLKKETLRKEMESKKEALRLKKEETKRQHEEEMKKHREMRKLIDDYIDRGAATPEFLRNASETQSGKELCPFFAKTGACRYGDICSRNHRRSALSSVILIPGFYFHFSLEKNSAEYDTDVSLEYETSETRQHFRDFYESVVPELETFGRIKTLKCCRNAEIHLRGNLYVEYYTEREAARAWRKLKGRYYAQRQLNCEFVNLPSWRNAVCGMAKCPKGRACNFLHTFRNPNDEYDIKSQPRWAKKNENRESACGGKMESRPKLKWDDWDATSAENGRNWRWSESPEREGRRKNERTRSNINVGTIDDDKNGKDRGKSSNNDSIADDDDDDDDERQRRKIRNRASHHNRNCKNIERSRFRSSRMDSRSRRREISSKKRSRYRRETLKECLSKGRDRESRRRRREASTSDEEVSRRSLRKLKKSRNIRRQDNDDRNNDDDDDDEEEDSRRWIERRKKKKCVKRIDGAIEETMKEEKSNDASLEKNGDEQAPVEKEMASGGNKYEWDTTDSE